MTFISDESVADQRLMLHLWMVRNVTADYIIQAVSSGLDKITMVGISPFNGRWYGLRNNRVIGQEWHATRPESSKVNKSSHNPPPYCSICGPEMGSGGIYCQ